MKLNSIFVLLVLAVLCVPTVLAQYDSGITCWKCPVCGYTVSITPYQLATANPYNLCPVCYSAYAFQFVQVSCQAATTGYNEEQNTRSEIGYQTVGTKTAQDWLDEGNALYDQGKYDEAIKAYDEAIRLDPNDADAWYNKGRSLGGLGKYDEAIKAYDEAIRLDPNYVDAWYNKGDYLNYLGKYDEAIKAYDEVIRLDPNDALARRALEKLGNIIEADASATTGYNEEQKTRSEIGNGTKTAQDWLDEGAALFNQGKYNESIEALDKAIGLDPNDALAWNNKGANLAALGKYDEAITALDQAIRLDPNDADAWYGKGLSLAALGKYNESVDAYDEAVRLDPTFALII